METDKPIRAISAGDTISLMSLLAAKLMGEERFIRASEPFKNLVIRGAAFATMENDVSIAQATIEANVAPVLIGTDCENLRTLIAQLNQAEFDMCQTCRPDEGPCPSP